MLGNFLMNKIVPALILVSGRRKCIKNIQDGAHRSMFPSKLTVVSILTINKDTSYEYLY